MQRARVRVLGKTHKRLCAFLALRSAGTTSTCNPSKPTRRYAFGYNTRAYASYDYNNSNNDNRQLFTNRTRVIDEKNNGR